VPTTGAPETVVVPTMGTGGGGGKSSAISDLMAASKSPVKDDIFYEPHGDRIEDVVSASITDPDDSINRNSISTPTRQSSTGNITTMTGTSAPSYYSSQSNNSTTNEFQSALNCLNIVLGVYFFTIVIQVSLF
jgi:hypothetical protein